MTPIDIAIIGFGKIAADQHLPAIQANPRFRLAAISSRSSGGGPRPCFTDYRDLLREVPDLQAVAITTPPGPRTTIARDCIKNGLHILLEKPPAATVSEAEELTRLAAHHQVTAFCTWHSRHNPAVSEAARLLQGKTLARLDVVWQEDVDKWHPGQRWIWEAGGFGVFDPGINALSIVTAIVDGALWLKSAALEVPSNAQTPIAAELEFASDIGEARLHCSLDWRARGSQQWSISILTTDGLSVDLEDGGSELVVNGDRKQLGSAGEYPAIYDHFANLIDAGRWDADIRPLRLVADAFLAGRRHSTDAIPIPNP